MIDRYVTPCEQGLLSFSGVRQNQKEKKAKGEISTTHAKKIYLAPATQAKWYVSKKFVHMRLYQLSP